MFKWFTIFILAAALVTTGCMKKKGKRGGSLSEENIGGVVGSDIYSSELGARPDYMGMEEYGSQFTPVLFDYDSSQILPGEQGKIEIVADYLASNPNMGVIVEGHTDERGSREYNLALGERRALAVRAYLVGLGVDGNRVQTKSMGEEQPAAMGHDEASWNQNRRGEFILFE